MRLDRFGEADALFLHCWSPRLCVTYASPSRICLRQTVVKFKTQSHCLRLKIFCKTGYGARLYWWFYIHVGPLITQNWELFDLRCNGIVCFQRWCLHCDKVRHMLYISSHCFFGILNRNHGPQMKRQLCRADPRCSYPWLTGTHYSIPCEKFRTFWETFHLHPPHQL